MAEFEKDELGQNEFEQPTESDKEIVEFVVSHCDRWRDHRDTNYLEDWKEFVDQLLQFPTANVHDDLVDALAYIDQMSLTSYQQDYDEDDYEVLDVISGY